MHQSADERLESKRATFVVWCDSVVSKRSCETISMFDYTVFLRAVVAEIEFVAMSPCLT